MAETSVIDDLAGRVRVGLGWQGFKVNNRQFGLTLQEECKLTVNSHSS